MTDHNPFLAAETARGRGEIEQPLNLEWQTRAAPPTDYENRLADALERMFAQGIEALPEVVRHLNQQASRDPSGEPWTEASFAAEMARLAA